MKKVIIALAVVILTAGYAHAQFKFGVRAGFNLTNMYSDNERAVNNMKPGFQAGVVVDYTIGNFAIQPGVVFATQGTRNDQSETNLYYVQIPVNVMYKFDLGGVKLFPQIGPYLGYGVGGKFKSKNSDYQFDFSFGNGEDDEYKAFDFGASVGAGIQFRSFQFGVGYSAGLISISNDDLFYISTNGLAFTLTYLFGK